jgi:hypothetical protein
MKQPVILILITLVSLLAKGQTVENRKLNCAPKSTNNSVFKQIGTAKLEDFSNRGTSWTFLSSQKITTKEGVIYLKGDLISPRGGKLNVKENKWEKPLFILFKEWDCIVDR